MHFYTDKLNFNYVLLNLKAKFREITKTLKFDNHYKKILPITELFQKSIHHMLLNYSRL
jgi:hypothetical protein